jgi:hypothetical protein
MKNIITSNFISYWIKNFSRTFFEFYKRITTPNDFPIHTINVNSELNFEF